MTEAMKDLIKGLNEKLASEERQLKWNLERHKEITSIIEDLKETIAQLETNAIILEKETVKYVPQAKRLSWLDRLCIRFIK